MQLNKIGQQPLGAIQPKQPWGETKGKESFAQIFSSYLDNVNGQLLDSEKLTADLATGKVNNLHDVTIAAQKASISLQLTVQVRDKAVEAYQELMRMQV